MRLGLFIRKNLLRFWRVSGLARIPVFRRLKDSFIPNPRAWDAADMTLQGFTADATASEIAANAYVDYWTDELIIIKDKKIDPKSGLGCALIVDVTSPTEQERAIYDAVQSDEAFPIFTSKNLVTIECSTETKTSVRNGGDERVRLIERIVSKTKEDLKKLRFVIAVNPTDLLADAVKSSSDTILLIVVRTVDFEGALPSEYIERADRVITPQNFKPEGVKQANSLVEYVEAEALYGILVASVRDLMIKEFNLLLPVWRTHRRITDIEILNQRAAGLVLYLDCQKAEAPTVTGTFREYVFGIAGLLNGVLASEEVVQRYANLLKDLESLNVRNEFLLRAFRDGVRCEFVYAG